jgi:hypothetical protein
MEYLPEWKLYLWKKLLVCNEGFEKADVMVVNFMFFSQDEQFALTLQKMQRQIDGIQYTYNEALAKRRAAEIVSQSNDTLIESEYFNFHPQGILGALVELMDCDPPVLSITAKLHRQYIARYREAKKTYDAQEYRKHLASRGMRNAMSYKPNTDFMNDPFCDLGKNIYEKTEAGEELTADEFRSLTGALHTSAHDCLMMNIKIDRPALEAKLDGYIDDFIAGNLVAPHGVLYFDASIQRTQIYSAVQAMTANFGVKNLLVTPERIAQYAGWPVGNQKYYRIFETLFSLEKASNVSIHDLRKGEVILSLVAVPEIVTPTQPPEEAPSVDDELVVQTQHGPLTLNKRTGDFEYGTVKGNLNPTSQEHKVLLKLMTSKSFQAPYTELVAGTVSKPSKMNLTYVVRNLKEALGILPVATAVNQDIIRNVKNLAYKLLAEPY